jgi:hypothetical protein
MLEIVLITLRLASCLPEPESPKGYSTLKNVRLYAL